MTERRKTQLSIMKGVVMSFSFQPGVWLRVFILCRNIRALIQFTFLDSRLSFEQRALTHLKDDVIPA